MSPAPKSPAPKSAVTASDATGTGGARKGGPVADVDASGDATVVRGGGKGSAHGDGKGDGKSDGKGDGKLDGKGGTGSRSKRGGPTMAERADRHRLYELAVQNPEFELDFIDATFAEMRGRKPRSMREDFCGTALSSVEWVRRRRGNTAIAVDIDADVLVWARTHNLSTLTKAQRRRLDVVRGDVREVETPRVDVVQAYNFSYWFFQERATMLAYFRRLRAALVEDGLLFLDVFGGSECYQTQKEKRKLDGFRYVWEQSEFNAITNELTCHIHFHFPDRSKLKNAFSYTWRVWGARELREILAEAGFTETIVYRQEFDEESDEALDEYIATDFAEDYACWLGYIVAKP